MANASDIVEPKGGSEGGRAALSCPPALMKYRLPLLGKHPGFGGKQK
jgi:hypothetical protein